MTREEIINVLQDDKMMPFIQPDQLAKIVDFVSENYKPSLPDGLEEAAEEHAGLNFDRQMEYKSFWNDVDTFITGAKWQKAKMMEDAVEGKVFMSFAPGHNQVVMVDVDFPTNTKVKVIIVKED